MRHRYLRPSLSLPEMLQSDLDIEYAIDARLNTVLSLCESDFVTRDMSWGCRTVCSPRLGVAINNLSQRLLGKAVAGYTEKFIPSIESLDDNFYLSKV